MGTPREQFQPIIASLKALQLPKPEAPPAAATAGAKQIEEPLPLPPAEPFTDPKALTPKAPTPAPVGSPKDPRAGASAAAETASGGKPAADAAAEAASRGKAAAPAPGAGLPLGNQALAGSVGKPPAGPSAPRSVQPSETAAAVRSGAATTAAADAATALCGMAKILGAPKNGGSPVQSVPIGSANVSAAAASAVAVVDAAAVGPAAAAGVSAGGPEGNEALRTGGTEVVEEETAAPGVLCGGVLPPAGLSSSPLDSATELEVAGEAEGVAGKEVNNKAQEEKEGEESEETEGKKGRLNICARVRIVA